MKIKMRNTGSTIKAGQLILSEKPFAFILSSQHKGSRCDNCLEKGKTLKCSGCHFVHYCGRACQIDAWPDHKWECANLKRVAPKVIPDAARMMARILNRLNKGDGQSYRVFYTATKFRMWKDLMSHYTKLKEDKKRVEHFLTLAEVLKEFLEGMTLPNSVELMGIYGRMVINSFTILDTDMNSIGTAIYIGSSIIDHSCDPNAVATFNGKTLEIRALKDIQHLDWEQIRISYIDQLKCPHERQAELLESYYFSCQCKRCTDGKQMMYTHAAKCPNPLCDGPVNLQDCKLVRQLFNGEGDECDASDQLAYDELIHCSTCNTKYEVKKMKKFLKTMKLTEKHLKTMKEASVAYVDVCRYCLSKQEGLLHPLNVKYAQTLDHAFEAHVTTQMWRQAIKYADKLIACYKFYYGDVHPLLGLLYLKYGKILLFQFPADVEKAHTQVTCAEKIIKITHGTSHPLYKEEVLPLLEQLNYEMNK